MKFLTPLMVLAMATTACTRIETGESGVRITMSKEVEKEELLPGSLNQVMFGDVLVFPVKSISVDVTNMTPLAADNSTIDDMDLSVIYSIDPTGVADIYINQSRNFHRVDNKEEDKTTYLMYDYIYKIARSAAYKATRPYASLQLNDNRDAIEELVRQEMIKDLKEKKLDKFITVEQVMVRQITPDKTILASANALVASQNEEKTKAVEVRTAKLEAERIATLNANSGAVGYMSAVAMMNISEGIKAGKVQTIVVPVDFRGMVNVNGTR